MNRPIQLIAEARGSRRLDLVIFRDDRAVDVVPLDMSKTDMFSAIEVSMKRLEAANANHNREVQVAADFACSLSGCFTIRAKLETVFSAVPRNPNITATVAQRIAQERLRRHA